MTSGLEGGFGWSQESLFCSDSDPDFSVPAALQVGIFHVAGTLCEAGYHEAGRPMWLGARGQVPPHGRLP